MKLFIYIIVGICFPFCLLAQETNQALIDQITAFIENQDDEGEFDFNTLYEQYSLLSDNPININQATKEELKSVYFLNELQIIALLEHRDKLGSLQSMYELQTIPGFDFETVSLLRNISYTGINVIEKTGTDLKSNRDWKHLLFIKWKRNIETQEGYTREDTTGFLGSPDHLYLRYRLTIGNQFQAGFIAEKDNGEPFYYPGKIYGADYYSFHAVAKNLTNNIRFLGVGDYNVSLGQGLIIHSGFGAGKSARTTSIRKGGYPLRPYSSVAEYNYLRGVATQIELTPNFEFSVFGSYKNREGNIQESNADDPFTGPFTSSLSEAGFHRTHNEVAKKNTVTQATVGGQVKIKNRYGHIAINGLYDKLNVPLIRTSQLYQIFNINSDQLWNTSIDYGYIIKNLNFFGEVAYSSSQAFAHLHGLMISLHRTLTGAISYRNYSPEYISLNANSFGESIGANNEEGIYFGLDFKPTKQWVVSAYADYWKHPWLKFRIDGPSHGQEYFVRIKYFKKRTWEIYAQYFYENKFRNQDAQIRQIVPTVKQRLRLHGAFKLSKAWEIRNRIEFSYFDESSGISNGFLLYQDILYKPVGKNFSFTSRYGFFDIDDFDARIYAYENDIINEYYIPAYNGQGFRFYLNARWRINYWLRAEARYEVTKYTELNGRAVGIDGNTIGSGRTEIDGDTRSAVKFQLRYSF